MVEVVPVATVAVEPRGESSGEARVELTGRFLRTRELPVDAEHLRRGKLLTTHMQGDAAQSFKMLRTQVLQRMRARSWNTLGIVGSTRGGQDHRCHQSRDGNLHGPGPLRVARGFRSAQTERRAPPRPGPDMWGGGCALREQVGRRRVHPPGGLRPPDDPARRGACAAVSELLGAEPARVLVEELKTRYADRMVLFDLPPLLGADDTLAFLPRVDAVLLVVAEGFTRAEHLTRALELLKDKPIVGTVLNRSRGGADAYYAY